jgi:hypothetical protein
MFDSPVAAIVRMHVRRAVQQTVAHVPNAAEIELRLGDSQREQLQRRVRPVTGDACRERARLG